MTISRVSLLYLAIAINTLATASHAKAEDVDDIRMQLSLEEIIIVAAQKREQSIIDVPIAITALSGAMLEQTGVVTTQDLAGLAPGLTIPNESPSGASNGFVFMRGIGTDNTQYTLDPAVGIYIDGVYFARAYGTIFDLFDVERVEVLRGPQGTLYGRNNSAGAIKVISKPPVLEGSDFAARVGIGSFEETRGEMTASGPIVEEKLGVRISASHRQNEGYQENRLLPLDRAQSIDFTGVKAALLWKPTATFAMTLRYNLLSDEGDAIQNEPLSDTTPRTFASQFENLNRVKNEDVSATINWEIAPDVDLTSITAHRATDLNAAFNLGGETPELEFFIPFQDIESRYVTQEIYLTSDSLGAIPLTWVIGGFYYDEDIEEQALTSFGDDIFPGTPAFSVPADREFRARSSSAYAQGTYYVTPNLGLTAGGRWTTEEKEFQDDAVGLALREFDDSETTWRAAIEYSIRGDILVFGSASSGFRSGGFDINTADEFPSETVVTYETGVKWNSPGSRFRVQANYYQSEYESLQQSITTSEGVGLNTVFFDATVDGLELEWRARLTDSLALGGNLALTNTDPDVPDPAVEDLKQSPELTGNVAAEYNAELAQGTEFSLRLAYTYVDNYFSESSNDPLLEVESTGTIDVRTALNFNEKWELALVGRNLSDEDEPPFNFFFGFPGLSNQYTKFNRTPRTWHLSLMYRH